MTATPDSTTASSTTIAASCHPGRWIEAYLSMGWLAADDRVSWHVTGENDNAGSSHHDGHAVHATFDNRTGPTTHGTVAELTTWLDANPQIPGCPCFATATRAWSNTVSAPSKAKMDNRGELHTSEALHWLARTPDTRRIPAADFVGRLRGWLLSVPHVNRRENLPPELLSVMIETAETLWAYEPIAAATEVHQAAVAHARDAALATWTHVLPAGALHIPTVAAHDRASSMAWTFVPPLNTDSVATLLCAETIDPGHRTHGLGLVLVKAPTAVLVAASDSLNRRVGLIDDGYTLEQVRETFNLHRFQPYTPSNSVLDDTLAKRSSLAAAIRAADI